MKKKAMKAIDGADELSIRALGSSSARCSGRVSSPMSSATTPRRRRATGDTNTTRTNIGPLDGGSRFLRAIGFGNLSLLRFGASAFRHAPREEVAPRARRDRREVAPRAWFRLRPQRRLQGDGRTMGRRRDRPGVRQQPDGSEEQGQGR